MEQAPDSATPHDRIMPRWLPMAGSAALMLMVAFLSVTTISQLKDAVYWRKHTFQVLLGAQAFQNNFLDVQRAARGYVVMGTPSFLAAYRNSTNLEQQEFEQLNELTRDNLSQQSRLALIAHDMGNVISYDNLLVATYNTNGPEGVLQLDAASSSRLLSDKVFDDLKTFGGTEQKLLDARDATEQEYYHSLTQLLIIGSIAAGLLLLLANYLATHELAHRHRVETKLKEVKKLQDAIIDSATYAIITTDKNGTVKTFNPAAQRILGYAPQEVVGKATPLLWRDAKEISERSEVLSERMGHPIRPTFETIVAKIELDKIDQGEWTFIRKDGTHFPASLVVTALTNDHGELTGYLGFFRDISDRKKYESDREKLVFELREALAQVKTLSGLIPICGWCKSVRSDTGYWQTVEQYVRSRTDATFTHGICPSCQVKFKDEIARSQQNV
ncbi:MAG TPA: PAS domain S-box protein [Verrucomicrobiae bacterium]|jgi:PAS domain S-box-containing protein